MINVRFFKGTSIPSSSKLPEGGIYFNTSNKNIYFNYSGNLITYRGSTGAAGSGSSSEIFNDYTNNLASGRYSHAEGAWTRAQGDYAHAEGFYTQARGTNAHSQGKYCIAGGVEAHAGGNSSNANGDYSFAHGIRALAQGKNSYAFGADTIATGIHSVTIGNETRAIGNESIALGYSSLAIGKQSLAGGNRAVTEGDDSFAFGQGTQIGSVYAITSHSGMTVTLGSAHNWKVGDYLVFKDEDTDTSVSFISQISTVISSTKFNITHTFPPEFTDLGTVVKFIPTVSKGNASIAVGTSVQSVANSQAVFGKYNSNDSNALFIVGNGTSTTPGNIFTVYNDYAVLGKFDSRIMDKNFKGDIKVEYPVDRGMLDRVPVTLRLFEDEKGWVSVFDSGHNHSLYTNSIDPDVTRLVQSVNDKLGIAYSHISGAISTPEAFTCVITKSPLDNTHITNFSDLWENLVVEPSDGVNEASVTFFPSTPYYIESNVSDISVNIQKVKISHLSGGSYFTVEFYISDTEYIGVTEIDQNCLFNVCTINI